MLGFRLWIHIQTMGSDRQDVMGDPAHTAQGCSGRADEALSAGEAGKPSLARERESKKLKFPSWFVPLAFLPTATEGEKPHEKISSVKGPLLLPSPERKVRQQMLQFPTVPVEQQ